tara:strand:+ start:185 stop:1093 length:909 start_codon:yes stop_codon:yes gene_type:complete
MRNNEERFGAPTAQSAEAPPVPIESGTPPVDLPENIAAEERQGQPTVLNFSIPTEIVDLPSRGRFYKPEHPLHQCETIEIRFMTAKDEDILTSKSLLRKGLAVDRLLSSVILDKRIKPDNLLVGDKNAIIMAVRSTGYGSEYSTKVQCPACLANSEFEFDLDDMGLFEGFNEETEGVVLESDGTFIINLPKMNVDVGLRLLTGREERQLINYGTKKSKHGLGEVKSSEQLKMCIVSVNGDRSSAAINNLMNYLPAKDARYLRKKYAEIMPSVDMTQDFICSTCGYEQEMEVPLTADFFWPKR